jgi:hypothetical protein
VRVVKLDSLCISEQNNNNSNTCSFWWDRYKQVHSRQYKLKTMYTYIYITKCYKNKLWFIKNCFNFSLSFSRSFWTFPIFIIAVKNVTTLWKKHKKHIHTYVHTCIIIDWPGSVFIALNRYFCIKGMKEASLARGGIINTRPEGLRDYKTPKGQNRRSRPKCKHYFL